MAGDSIDKLLASRRSAEQPAREQDKFYSVISGDGLEEKFIELQYRIGIRTCFAYGDLSWFNYDPEAGCIDLEFGGYLVTVKGRNLYPALFHAIKGKRVAWIKEADTELQDHEGNELYIAEITVTPPEGFAGEEESKQE
jgi:hypothetical protein